MWLVLLIFQENQKSEVYVKSLDFKILAAILF